MMRTPVSSSNIRSIGYDENSKILEIEFNNGSVYQYYNVPAEVYNGLMSAPSHGRYLDTYIKKGPYQYRKIR